MDLNRRSKSRKDDSIEMKPYDTSLKTVHVRTIFTKMGEIDTAKECFTAEVVIQAKWRVEDLDGATEEEIRHLNYDRLWSPKLTVNNLITEMKDVTSFTVIFPDDNRVAYVLWQKKLKGIFMENLELHEFPFDIQDITVTITSELTSTQVQLLDDNDSVVNTHSFVDEQEWKLRSEVRVESGENEDIIFGGRSVGRKYPYLNFKCTAERRYQYFLWNFAFILIFICLMCLAIFSVESKFTQNRLQLTFILLLTTIAFKTNINNTLPKISYLTYMDIYFLGSWVIQCLMCAWHAIVGSLLRDHPHVVQIDWGILIAFFLLLVGFQGFWAIFAFRRLKKKKRVFDKLLQNDVSRIKLNHEDEEMKLPTGPVMGYSAIENNQLLIN